MTTTESSPLSRNDKLPDRLPTRGRVLVRAAAVYDVVQPVVTLGQEARLNRWVADRLSVPKGGRVLDVGCGTGLLTATIAYRHPDADVVGIDASGPMIRVARMKRASSNCCFEQALAESLPFEDASMDVVTSALFFHHVDLALKARCVSEIYRVLRPGGTLVIADMDRPYTWLGWAMSWTAWKLFRQPEIKENMDGRLHEVLKENGFPGITEIGRFSGYIRVLQMERST